MRRCFICLFVIISFFSCTPSKSDYQVKLEKYRSEAGSSFSESVLDSNERKDFAGIHYFDIDENYRVQATVTWLPQMAFIEMKHSAGDTRPYMKVAELHFTLNDKVLVLQAYQTEEMRSQHLLFVPFTDETNGNESYGAGRYLDVNYNPASSSEVELDFNYAYAPYCAYTHRYSCPVVPAENDLPVAVKAGERAAMHVH